MTKRTRLFLTIFLGGIVIARAIARDVAEGVELTRFFAILMMVNGLAPILAPVIGGQVLLFADWRGIFVLLIIVGLVQTGATVVYRETLPVERRIADLGASFRKFPALLHDQYFLGHCLTQCFVFGAFFSYLAGSTFLFQNIYHVTPQVFSLIFGGIGVGLLVCGIVPARLAGRVPDVELLMGSIAIPIIGSAALLAGFLLDAPIGYTLPVLFVTIVPLSVMGAASFSLALSRQGKRAHRLCADDIGRPHDAARRHRGRGERHPDGRPHARGLHAGRHHVPHAHLPGSPQGWQDHDGATALNQRHSISRMLCRFCRSFMHSFSRLLHLYAENRIIYA